MKLLSSILVASGLLVAASQAQANDCELTITGNDQMQYDKQSLSVPKSCKEVTLTLKHSGKMAKAAMGHNWVLSKAGDMNDITKGVYSAGLENNYVPDSDKVIAHTKVVGGGEQTSITFSTEALSADQDYVFFCSFPGHWSVMKGDFKVTQ